MNDQFNPKNATDEDWTMAKPNENLPPNETLIEPIEDWSMTGKLVPPKQGQQPDWKMPEPKFRVTSGALPKNFVKNQTDVADLETQPLSFDEIEEFTQEIHEQQIPPTQEIPSTQKISEPVFEQSAAVPLIVEQPDIAEAFAPAPEVEIENPPEEKPRSKAMRIFLAVLGLSAMLFFAVTFLVVVYFLFFYKANVE